MKNQRWTIQCPKCGRRQQVEPRPGDYRCPYCGTKDYFDFDSDESTQFAPLEPPMAPPRLVMASAPASRLRWARVLLGLLLGGVAAAAYYWGRQ